MTQRAITIQAIQLVVSRRYGVSIAELKSVRRESHILHARMVAAYLACSLTTLSTPVIGRAFGGRDHTTIISARDVIAERMRRNLALAGEIQSLERELQHAGIATAFGLGLEHAAELDAALNALGLELAIVPLGTRDAFGFAKRTGGSK